MCWPCTGTLGKILGEQSGLVSKRRDKIFYQIDVNSRFEDVTQEEPILQLLQKYA